MQKPFRVSIAYIKWAHESAAEDGSTLAKLLCDAPDHQRKFKLIDQPVLVAEIADVAELYVGGGETDLRAAGVLYRAKKWLAAGGHNKRALLKAAHAC